ncbi:MAG: hypothetical protein ABIF11_05520 [Nitrospirota bacterium]
MIRKLLILIFGLFILLPNPCFSQNKEDKLDRIITEIAVLKEGQRAINQRIDDLDNKISTRIDDLRNELKSDIGDLRGLIYVLLGGILALIGFVLWDRRTALIPAVIK